MKDGYGKIRIFSTEEEVLNKIKSLTSEGLREEDIYVISEERKGSSDITDRTNVNYQKATGSIGDKFASFFSSHKEEEPEDKVLKRFGLNVSERDQLINALTDGKILLYVDTGDEEPKTLRPDDRVQRNNGLNDSSAGAGTMTTTGSNAGDDQHTADREHSKKIEVYAKETEALGRISELQARGLPENRIYVFSDNPENAAKLTAETEITYKSTKRSGSDKLTSLFSSEDPEEKVIARFIQDLSEREKEQYAQELKEGKILLYADASE